MVHAESPRDPAQANHDDQGSAPEQLHEITNLVKNAGECANGADVGVEERHTSLNCNDDKALATTTSDPGPGFEPAGTMKNVLAAGAGV